MISTMNTDNAPIWEYFQNSSLESFDDSAPRFRYLIAQSGKPSGVLLNIGAGNGALERLAAVEGWNVISVDPDASTLAKLSAPRIDTRQGVIENLPVDSDSVNVVVVSEVFEHLSPESMSAGLKEITRILKPTGKLLGTVPYRESLAANMVFCPDCKKVFHRWGHQQTFDVPRLREAVSAHLHPVTIRPRFFLDWKSTLAQFPKVAASFLGIHSGNEHIFFVCRPNSKRN
jgi:SAM-dependent methyltransferase